MKPRGFDCRTSTGLGEAETPLLEGTHKVGCTSGPRGRSGDPIETEPDVPASVGGSAAEAGGGCGSPWGKDTDSRSSGKYSLA